MRERLESPDVVGVEVGENHPAHRRRVDPEAPELCRRLVGRPELEAREPEERVPRGEIAGLCRAGGLAGVEDTDTLRVLDREDVHGERAVTPGAGQVPTNAAGAALRSHLSGRDAMDSHRRLRSTAWNRRASGTDAIAVRWWTTCRPTPATAPRGPSRRSRRA